MKSFSQIVNQSTVKDGSLKSGLALTKLAQADLDVSFDGTITVEGKNLEIGAVLGAALLPAYDAKYSIELADLLDLYSGGYVASIQRQIAKAGVSGTSKRIINHGSVLTAQEYLEGNLKHASIDCLSLYNDIVTLLANNPTKDKLINFVDTLKEQLLPIEVLEVYENKLQKETELKNQFFALSMAGFGNISEIEEDIFKAYLPLTAANNLSELAKLGYILLDSQVNIETASILVTFKLGSEQPKLA